MRCVSILIPTRDRPRPLARALASLDRQRLPEGWHAEVVVADNSDAANAVEVVRSAARKLPTRIVVVPRPGVAGVRNAALRIATGEAIAFLDDDCEAEPDWLAARLTALDRHAADACFGPRIARFEGAPPDDARWFETAYSCDLALDEGEEVAHRYAHLPLTGAVLSRACLAGPEPFDPRLDEVGGEDILLFLRLRLSGQRMVWSPQGTVFEHIPSSRVDRSFLMRRRYLSGQHRCLVPMLAEPPQRGETLRLMAEGAAAVSLAGPLALAGRAAGRWPPRPTALLMSGLGRLTWWRKDGPRFYGAAHR